MADDAPAPAPSGAPPIDYNAIIQQIMQGSGPVTGPAAPATPAVNTNLPITSLLGEAFGGGVSPLYPMSEAQQTQAGNAALLNFGIGMLQNASGPVRHSLGQAIASGLLGAQGSLAGVREGQAQMLDVQNKQQQMGLEKLKTILPLLMRQQAAGMPNPLLGGGGAPGGGGGIAATGAPITTIARDPSIPTVGQQANNSGNLMVPQGGSLPTGSIGVVPASGGRMVAAFPDASTGIAAQSDNLAGYANAGVNTIRGAVNRWVGDPKANTDSYVADIAKAAGVDPDAKIDLTNPAIQRAFFMAQQPHESGKPWLNPADVDKGIALAAARRTAPPGATRTATAPPTPTTPPAPVARPAAAPATPSGTIQGTPDTGGTQVGGPGALRGVIRPPGPLVPGDVGAIVGGMTKAGASPTTLAPGTATAGPTAPTIAQGGPTTVTPPAQPTPQPPAQGDQPPALGGPLTIEQYRAMHPSVIDPSTYTVTPPNLDELRKSQAAAAQQLDMARKGLGGDPNKSLSDYNTATQAITKAQQDAQAKSLELQQAAQKNADDLTLQGYNAEMTRQQEARLKAQELAQTAAENDKQRQNAIDIERLKAGWTATQHQQDADMQVGRTQLDGMNTAAQKAEAIQPMLRELIPLLKTAPSGLTGQMLQAHPDWIPTLTNLGLDPRTATVTQLVNGLTDYLSLDLKPSATGAMRVTEIPMLKGLMPQLGQSPQAQQQALARILNYTQRVKAEADFANEGFGAVDPQTNQPNYKILYKNIDAPMQLDENGNRSGGGLGPVVPEAPAPVANPNPGQIEAARRYQKYVTNLPSGMPYNTYERQADGSLQRTLKIHD